MMSCIVLAGQILLFSDREALILPANLGVQIDPVIIDMKGSERTHFRFFSDVDEEQPSEAYTVAPYAEVVAALADCETN